MTDYLDLIEEGERMYGGTAIVIHLKDGVADVQPSIDRGWSVYLCFQMDGEKVRDGHLTNQQAMALGLALIRCAREQRENNNEDA